MASPFEDAVKQMNLTPQEQNLYQHHLTNLYGPGKVSNPSGSISTMLQAVVPGPGGKYYNIPTVWNGQAVDVYTAAQLAGQAGWNNWPSYPTPDTADIRYERMHDYLERDTESYQQTRDPVGSYKRGGKVKKTGLAKVHKGERVLTARQAKKVTPAKLRAITRAPAKSKSAMRAPTRRARKGKR